MAKTALELMVDTVIPKFQNIRRHEELITSSPTFSEQDRIPQIDVPFARDIEYIGKSIRKAKAHTALIVSSTGVDDHTYPLNLSLRDMYFMWLNGASINTLLTFFRRYVIVTTRLSAELNTALEKSYTNARSVMPKGFKLGQRSIFCRYAGILPASEIARLKREWRKAVL
jgi:hypothetical protein